MSIMTKFKIFTASIIVIILIVIVIVYTSFDNNNRIMNTEQSYDAIGYAIIVCEVAKKDNNWNNFPLSKNFKKKYNSKYGILGKEIIFDNINWKISTEEDKKNQIVTLVVLNKLKIEDYYIHYKINDKNELDDIDIVKKVVRQNDAGVRVIEKSSMTEDKYIDNICSVAAPLELNDDIFNYINTTDNYYNKWQYGFIITNDYVSIDAYKDLCSFRDKLVYIKCRFPIRDDNYEIIDEKERYYKVHYYTNEDLWLDDVEVEEVSKEEIDRLRDEKKN